MVSPARIRTNNLLAKAFNLNDFLDPTRLAHDELQYYNDLTRAFDKIISHHIDWLDSPEAKKLFYEEIQNREEYFQTIDSDLDDIIRDTSLSADRIIEKVYRKGLNYGYKDINRLPVFNDACKYGLKATQEYNFELIRNVSNDLKDSIKHHIFRGVAEGQSIHEVARAITDSGLQPLKNKTLSAYQRASLIARTEIARSMTTGRLQSYANYGVEKVKILTAGDNNVCPICLEAAHVFNGEKTHDNIIGEKVYSLEDASDLIPFHPACRCSVIAHIEHYQDIPQKPIDNRHIINLTPLKFNDSGELMLQDGKPDIKWTKESLREKLYNFVDSEKELNDLVEGIFEYLNTIENRNVESLSAMGYDYNMYCDQHTLESYKDVELCSKAREEAEKRGLLFVIHNHPSNNPLHSEGDIIGFAEYGIKYNIVFTENRGILILKNNGASESTVKDSWNKIYGIMKDRFIQKYPDVYKTEEKMYLLGYNSRSKFKENIKKKVVEYMSNNVEETLGVYYGCMVESKIGMLLESP